MADTPYMYGISTDALRAIDQKLRQKRAMGGVVEPWELEAAYKAALSSGADNASSNYYKNKALDSSIAFQNAGLDLQREGIEANKQGEMTGAIGNLATTGLMVDALTTKPGDKMGITKLWDKYSPFGGGADKAATTAPDRKSVV
jgi:hypothetical protein